MYALRIKGSVLRWLYWTGDRWTIATAEIQKYHTYEEAEVIGLGILQALNVAPEIVKI